MAEIKKLSTELQVKDKLLDTSGDAGTSGQVLSSTGTGTNWINAITSSGGTFSGNIVLDDGSGASPNIQFVNANDDDWYIYNDSNGKFQVQQNSTIRATFSSGDLELTNDLVVNGGTLQLGSDVTLYRDGSNILRTDDVLHANGHIHVGGVSGGGSIYNRADTTNNITFSSTGLAISKNTTFSGTVAIGMAATANDLDIFNSGNAALRLRGNGQATLVIDSDADDSGTAGAYLTYRDNGASKWILYKETNNDFYLYNIAANKYPIHAKANGHIVLMEDGNNLGVGASSPSYKLHVKGTVDGNVNTAVENTSTGSDAYATYRFVNNSISNAALFLNGSNNTNYAGASSLNLYQGSNNPLGFVTNNVSRMIVTGAGNVGIGTNSPGQKLEVAGRVRVTTDPTIEFYEASNKRGGIQWDLTNDYTNIFAVGGNIRFDIGGQKLLIESATSTFETDIVVNSADLKLLNTGSGNAYIKAYASGTGAAGLYIDAVNGDGAGSDYFSLRQLDSKAIEFNARTGTGNTLFYSKGVLNLTQNGANSTFAGDVTVSGNLNVTGDINSVSVTDLDVTDKTITVGVGQTAANSSGSGIAVSRSDSTNPSLLWNQSTSRFDFNTGLTVTGQVHTTGSVYAKGSLFVKDTDSTNNHVQVRSNGTEGFITVSNGSNWGLIMRGSVNDPRIGAYYNGVLKIEGFHSSDGSTGANAVDLAQFDFGNERFVVNGDIHVGSNYIGRDADNYIGFVTDNLIKFRVNGATQVKLSDGVFAPQTDSDVDLGSNGTRFATGYFDAVAVTNTLTADGATFTGDIQAPGIYVGSTNTSYDFYNNGTSYLNGAVTIDDNLTVSSGSISISGDGANAVTLTESGSGDFTIDAADDIRLDAGGGDIVLRANGSEYGRLSNSSGDFIIKNITDNKDIIFQSDDGSGGLATYFTVDGANEDIDFSKSPHILDSVTLKIGSASGGDLQLYHNGSHSLISNQTGNLYIRNQTNDGDILLQADDGSGGDTTYLSLDGGISSIIAYKDLLFGADSIYAKWGASQDLVIGHDGSNSKIENNTGHLNIIQEAADKDISFYCDDGSGGTEVYFYCDGSGVRNVSNKNFRIIDSKELSLGSSDDFRIQHNGSNTLITNNTGNILFTQNANDQDITFYNDDGSGGVTEYFRVDGDTLDIRFSKHILLFDNVQLRIGASNDLQILHDASDSFLINNTGDLYLRNLANDKDIIFQSDDGSGGTATYFFLDGSNVRNVASKDILFNTGVSAYFHSVSTGLRTVHDGSNAFLINSTGNLTIQNGADDSDIIFQSDDGSGGTENYIQIDGSEGRTLFNKHIRVNDNVQIQIGSSNDAYITHNGTNTYFVNGVGNLEITNDTNDGDIIFKSDDGSGGTATYMYLDGGNTRVQFNKGARFVDSQKLQLGSSGDLNIFHDGAASKIENDTGHLILRNNATDCDIVFQLEDDGSTQVEYMKCDSSLGRTTFYKQTTHLDSVRAIFGTGYDLKIQHTGSESQIFNSTGQLDIRTSSQLLVTSSGGENMIKAVNNGAVELYYDNTKTLETTSTGVSVTGVVSDRNVPCIITAAWNDSTSTTDALFVPLNGSLTEAKASSAGEQHYFVAPQDCILRTIFFKGTGAVTSGTWTTQIKIYKNGTNYTSSTELAYSGTTTNASISFTVADGTSAIGGVTFAAGDEVQIAYQKSATSKYWQDVTMTAIIELIDYDI